MPIGCWSTHPLWNYFIQSPYWPLFWQTNMNSLTSPYIKQHLIHFPTSSKKNHVTLWNSKTLYFLMFPLPHCQLFLSGFCWLIPLLHLEHEHLSWLLPGLLLYTLPMNGLIKSHDFKKHLYTNYPPTCISSPGLLLDFQTHTCNCLKFSVCISIKHCTNLMCLGHNYSFPLHTPTWYLLLLNHST